MAQFKKETRIAVWNKYNQKCAYCGNDLPYKKMQVDHFLPKRMMSNSLRQELREEWGISDINEFKNLMPSCRSCNHYKNALGIDTFRERMYSLHERIRQVYINKVAENYGIITVTPFDGWFWFEKF